VKINGANGPGEGTAPLVTCEKRRPDPFFIVGADRSGTTLLAIMVSRHPMVAIPPESEFIPRLSARRYRYGADGLVARPGRFLRDLAAESSFRKWGIGVEPIREALEAAGAVAISQAIDIAFLSYARSKAKAGWGNKTPRYVRHIPLLAQLIPDARFVHIIRDGRDVALSTLDLKHFHRHAATVGFFWKRAVMAGRRSGRALSEGRYLEVHYEDVVNNPEAESKRVLEFLGLPYDPAVLRQDEPHVPLRPPGKWSENRRPWLPHRPPTKGLRDWRRDMSPREVAEFEVVAGSTLAYFGYERAAGGPVLRSWSRAWLRVAWFPIRTLWPRLRSSVRADMRRIRSRKMQRTVWPTGGLRQ
jgi:hypothetical protein